MIHGLALCSKCRMCLTAASLHIQSESRIIVSVQPGARQYFYSSSDNDTKRSFIKQHKLGLLIPRHRHRHVSFEGLCFVSAV